MADIQTLKDDIAFMRALAQEGRTAPLLGGSVMIAAGLTFGTASLAAYAAKSGLLAVGSWVQLVIWIGAAVVFFTALAVISARLRGRPGAASPGNRALRGAWRGIGFAIGCLWIVLMLAAWRLHNFELFGLFPSVILALYGAAWSLAAQMSERRWMNGVSALCFGMAIVVAALIGKAELYLAYTAALALVAILPGAILVRQAPSDIV